MALTKKQLEKLTIIIDSRELTPISFTKEFKTITKGMPTGDYSFIYDGVDYSDRFAIERKSLKDASNCTNGEERERVEREIERAKTFDFFSYAVESDFKSIWGAFLFHGANKKSIVATVHSYNVKFPWCHSIWVSNRSGLKSYILDCISSYIRNVIEKKPKTKIAKKV